MLTKIHGNVILQNVNMIHGLEVNKMVNTQMLTDAIRESGLKNGYIAASIGISMQSLQRKVEGKTEFKASEIAGFTSVLRLSRADRDLIFLQQE